MTKTRRFIIECLGALAVFIGLSVVVGRLFGFEFLANWGYGPGLSTPAATAVFVLGISVWMLVNVKQKE